MEVSYQTGPAQIGAASGQANSGARKAIEQVSFIKGRLRRLEGRMQGGRCPKCGLRPDGPGYIVITDGERRERSFDGDPDEHNLDERFDYDSHNLDVDEHNFDVDHDSHYNNVDEHNLDVDDDNSMPTEWGLLHRRRHSVL